MDSMNNGSPNYPEKIKYEYVPRKDLPMIYAHGVWGGINSHGEIEVNFYTESDKLPVTSQREVLPDGSVGPEIPDDDPQTKTIVRNVHAKVVVSYQTARAVIEWLEDKIATLEMEGGGPFPPMDEGQGPAQ